MMSQEEDPIKASYEVFVKPRISADRQLYVLQFPNRDARQNYNSASGAEPLTMRIKPTAGMVEIDVPIDAFNNYDREKGIKWGDALNKSRMAKGGGSHGLPGGFGIGGAQPSGRGRGTTGNKDISQEAIMSDFESAVKKEQVLVRQTLGGQAIAKDKTTPQYMIGTFRKNQLHLTPVDDIVQMRPQFHHIDATVEQERINRVRDVNNTAKSEARAVHVTFKSQVDGESVHSGEKPMAVRIATAQAEPWKNHRYVDEDSDEAWIEYSESMFVCSDLEKTEEILDKLPKLKSAYNDNEYLDVICGRRHGASVAKNIENDKQPGVDSNNVQDRVNYNARDSGSSSESE